MLSGLPSPKVLMCTENKSLSGNVNSLRDCSYYTLSLSLWRWQLLEGAGWLPISEIIEIEQYCRDRRSPRDHGWGYQFHRISDVPAFVNSFHRLQKRKHTLFDRWFLSRSSPDWYDWDDHIDRLHGLSHFLRQGRAWRSAKSTGSTQRAS